jgi:hypothetical protein
MPSRRRINSNLAALTAIGTIALGIALGGCAYAINPWADDAVPPEQMTTPSERDARAARDTHPPTPRQRDIAPSTVAIESGDVVHWPLWFEDPFEDKGSEDGRFAWTLEDYIAMPYSAGRLLLNTIAFPVSAVVTPPGTPMVSDGKLSRQALGYDHDATVLKKRNYVELPESTTQPVNSAYRTTIQYEDVGPVGQNAMYLDEESEEEQTSAK